jgi:hypothetical protein
LPFYSRGFINNRSSFCFNTMKQIFLFLHLLTFRSLPDVKQTQIFCHITFSGNTRAGEEEVNGKCHEGQKRATGPQPWPRGGAISGLVRCFDTILVSTDLVLSKTNWAAQGPCKKAFRRRKGNRTRPTSRAQLERAPPRFLRHGPSTHADDDLPPLPSSPPHATPPPRRRSPPPR